MAFQLSYTISLNIANVRCELQLFVVVRWGFGYKLQFLGSQHIIFVCLLWICLDSMCKTTHKNYTSFCIVRNGPNFHETASNGEKSFQSFFPVPYDWCRPILLTDDSPTYLRTNKMIYVLDNSHHRYDSNEYNMSWQGKNTMIRTVSFLLSPDKHTQSDTDQHIVA